MESEFHRIRTTDAARLEFGDGSPDALVMEFTFEGLEEPVLFWLHDAEAFKFIRQMTDVLFNAETQEEAYTRGGTA